MIDIDFYRYANDIRKSIDNNKKFDKKHILDLFEVFRNKQPIVYNIETTNSCNMKCIMCPRTTMMTRKVETIDRNLFVKIIDQLKPFTEDQWKNWKRFCVDEYNIQEDEMSENNFFLYIIPRVLQLHAFGDPLLDKNMPYYVKLLHDKGFYSYFSCNPANIDIDKMVQMFENGLDYIKYSIESVDDQQHKDIRGSQSNFTDSYNNIKKLLQIKKDKGYKTTIIITMLNLNRRNQNEEFELLKKAFEGLDVYIYLKSEDQQWYRKDYHGTQSIHWSEFCKHPWMSMSIKSNGEVAMCMEDFNNEIVLGDVNKNSLIDIWNGDKYKQFRYDHVYVDNNKEFKCSKRCDMNMIGELM